MIYRVDTPSRSHYLCERHKNETIERMPEAVARYSAQWQGETCEHCTRKEYEHVKDQRDCRA